MDTYNPNQAAGAQANAGANQQDGSNANQGGDNSQGQGGSQNQGGGAAGGNANANQDQGAGGNQAGGEDYKVKFGESTKENQRLMDIFKKNGIDPKTGEKVQTGNANNQVGNDAGATFFTDEELEATFPSYATMTDQERQVLRHVGSFPKMARMVAEMHDKLAFSEQLEVLKADTANAVIAQNEKEFKAFAYKDENLKVPMEILVNAFKGMKAGAVNNAGQNNAGEQKPQQKRAGMENSTAGQGSSGNGVQEMTPEAARDMRTKDPRKYNELARAGKLKIVSGK